MVSGKNAMTIHGGHAPRSSIRTSIRTSARRHTKPKRRHSSPTWLVLEPLHFSCTSVTLQLHVVAVYGPSNVVPLGCTGEVSVR